MLQARSRDRKNFPIAAGREWNNKDKVPCTLFSFNSVFYDVAKL